MVGACSRCAPGKCGPSVCPGEGARTQRPQRVEWFKLQSYRRARSECSQTIRGVAGVGVGVLERWAAFTLLESSSPFTPFHPPLTTSPPHLCSAPSIPSGHGQVIFSKRPSLALLTKLQPSLYPLHSILCFLFSAFHLLTDLIICFCLLSVLCLPPPWNVSPTRAGRSLCSVHQQIPNNSIRNKAWDGADDTYLNDRVLACRTPVGDCAAGDGTAAVILTPELQGTRIRFQS